ncbi:hypothetical protein M758_2G161200 [Ceratodon purpureus]|nr:hypothetical protein M758_2G161200 [Ceratodon purpureus]
MARRSCVCGICESVNLPSVCTACINQRLLERYKLVKNLAQDRDMLRRTLDEELLATVRLRILRPVLLDIFYKLVCYFII